MSSAGLATTGQPAASAGASLKAAVMIGKFHGRMIATGPTGSCSVYTWCPPPSTGITVPPRREGAPAKCRNVRAAIAVSARERSMGLPLSRVSRIASASSRSSMRSATRFRMRARSSGASPRQRRSAWASTAVATAASTSAAVASATVVRTSPVAGSMTARARRSPRGIHSPPRRNGS